MKLFKKVLIAALKTLGLSVVIYAFIFTPIVNALKAPALVKLNVSGYQTCSAFVVALNYAFTAAHCVNGTGLEIVSENGKIKVPAAVYKVNTLEDTAILFGDFSRFKQVDVYDLGIKDVKLELCGYPHSSAKIVCYPYKLESVVLKPLTLAVGVGQGYHGMSGGF